MTTSDTVPVTVDNFSRAEADLIFGGMARDGALGWFLHHRELMTIDSPIVRPNRDTLYSTAVFDLEAGPVTITLPDAGRRFMSMQVVDEDQFCPGVFYGAGRYTFSRDRIGTRYISVRIRTLVDPVDAADLETVHALQDAIEVEQTSPGRFEVPRFDPASQRKVRAALLALGETIPDSRRMFGPGGEVDPVRHLIGTAMGFGRNPERHALYLDVTPSRNDGATIYRLTLRDVPVDGFWSVSVYDAEGHFVPNPADAYSLNNITARRNPDGSVTIQFGGCDDRTPNCLPIVKGWNYTVRLYRPRAEILSGAWIFPEARPQVERAVRLDAVSDVGTGAGGETEIRP